MGPGAVAPALSGTVYVAWWRNPDEAAGRGIHARVILRFGQGKTGWVVCGNKLIGEIGETGGLCHRQSTAAVGDGKEVARPLTSNNPIFGSM